MADRWEEPEFRAWERERIERARRGDREAFGELYDAFASELYRRVLFPRLGNAQAAEDALSETFRTLLEKLDGYEDQGKSVWHWLARVAANKATDVHRGKGRATRALASFEGLLAPLLGSPETPGAAFEADEDRGRLAAKVREVMERINPRYRRAIELRFFEERPREDCARVLEVKTATFDVLILRALRAFRREWETVLGARTSEI